MNIAVEKQFQDWITEQVKSGRYRSEVEVVEQALREKMEKDEADYFRTRLRLAQDDIREGRTVAADDAFFEGLKSRIGKAAEKSGE